MPDPEAQRKAMMSAVLRVLTMKAGGRLSVSRQEYEKYVKPDIHFHMFRVGSSIECVTSRAADCMWDDDREAPSIITSGGRA